MIEADIFQIIASIGTVIATGFAFSKIFFNRVDKLELILSDSISDINKNLSRIDKTLAVNTALIEQHLNDNRGE